MMIDKDTLLATLDYRRAFEACGVQFLGQPKADGNCTVRCPLEIHVDKNPSFSAKLTNPGFWKCFSCGSHGDILALYQMKHRMSFPDALTKLGECSGTQHSPTVQVKPQPPERVLVSQIDAWHGVLLQDLEAQKEFCERYALTPYTLTHFLVGFDTSKQDFIIPLASTIFHEPSVIIDDSDKLQEEIVRWMAVKRRPRDWTKPPRNPAGIRAQLYNAETLTQGTPGTVCITEGECKVMLLEQLGFKAVSSTGGAKTFFSEWIEAFRDWHVRIIFDVDPAGKEGAEKVAKLLLPVAHSVKIVTLPLSGTKESKDITDYIKAGYALH